MSLAEFWITTAVVEYWAPVAWLSAENREEIFNLPPLNLSHAGLVTVLDRLFAQGDLVAKRQLPENRFSGGLGRFGDPFTLRSGEIEDALTETPLRRVAVTPTYYGLTQEGGTRWETIAQPKWDEYVDSWIDVRMGEGGVIGQDRTLVERHLDAWSYPQGLEILSVARRELRPWQATYWKALPVGYQVLIQTRPVSSEALAGVREEPKWVRELRRRASRWYSWPNGED